MEGPRTKPEPGADLEPLAGAQVPSWTDVAHSSPFVCRIVPDDRSSSRSIPHVSNIEYLRWVDRAAELHARVAGLSRESLLASNRMWFVARHELDYIAECWPGEELRLATWVRTVGRVQSWRDTTIWREDDRKVIFRGSTLWVLVDILSRRPARIDAEMVRQLRPLEATGRGPADPRSGDDRPLADP